LSTERNQQGGFDAALLTWRHTNAVAALRFVDEVAAR
jgi:hypothetical protein